MSDCCSNSRSGRSKADEATSARSTKSVRTRCATPASNNSGRLHSLVRIGIAPYCTASSTAMGRPSLTDGRTKNRVDQSAAAFSRPYNGPTKRTLAAPSTAATTSCSYAGSPQPATVNTDSRNLSDDRQLRINSTTCFFGCKRPRNRAPLLGNLTVSLTWSMPLGTRKVRDSASGINLSMDSNSDLLSACMKDLRIAGRSSIAAWSRLTVLFRDSIQGSSMPRGETTVGTPRAENARA